MGANAVALSCGSCLVPTPNSTQQKCKFCLKDVCKTCKGFPVFDKYQDKHFSGCKECFKKANQIDLSTSYEIIGENNTKEIVFLHGATSSRLMFQAHAHDLAKKGFRSILVDLPGHGSKMDEALDIDNCENTIRQALQLCRSREVTIIGGSLGGYILMNLLGRNPSLCKKAVVLMCGQNVGVNRSLKATFGLWAMNKSFNLFSESIIANNFLSMTKNIPNLQAQKVEKMVRGGCYLRHADQNIQLLKNCNYRQSLTKTQGKVPILFINGSEDYRDSQKIWVQAAGKSSKLIVYEGGDHFFSHDKRFYNKLLEDIQAFILKDDV